MSDKLQVFGKWVRTETTEGVPVVINTDHIRHCRRSSAHDWTIVFFDKGEYADSVALPISFEVFCMALMGMVGPRPPQPRESQIREFGRMLDGE